MTENEIAILRDLEENYGARPNDLTMLLALAYFQDRLGSETHIELEKAARMWKLARVDLGLAGDPYARTYYPWQQADA